MGTDTTQPRRTKERLVNDGLRAMPTKHRRDLARDLLGGTALPERWLTAEQRAFVALRPGEKLNARTGKAGDELVDRVIVLCDQLIPGLVDDYLRRHVLDRDARQRFRRLAPAVVRDALLRRCKSWPSADIHGLKPWVRKAVDKALTRLQARTTPAAEERGLVLRPDDRPEDDRDFKEKLIIWATSGEALLRRCSRFLWGDVARHAVRVAVAFVVAGALAILYLVLFEVLRYLEPTLTVREALLVVGAAFGAAFGGTGIGMLGSMLKDRWVPGRSGRERPATRSDDEDPARPGSR
jgi:hypothetical protein